ncbi:hypothetical protein Sjap_014680 [Stephania japonica]|uniref:Uncharacterized protein n=1 Tax=Stephania japonica TaxID=461633 RepID=A0AAP0NQN9_9MAGN
MWFDCLEIFMGNSENPERKLRDSKQRASKSLVEAQRGQQWRTEEGREKGLNFCP